MPATHTTIFDAGKGYGSIASLRTLVDCTIARRQDRWWMFACGVESTSPEINMFSASLPEGAPLSAKGWMLTADAKDSSRPELVAGKAWSYPWDGKGGRHCPSYVKGWDPEKNAWVERIYYAGAAQSFMGPYVIGYVEWDGAHWADQPAPAFAANESWERGSVYEPNLIYHDGKWKMWYVAGANQDDYLVQGYSESRDGRTGWSSHQIVFAAEEKVFDFCVIPAEGGFEAVFARVNVSNADLPKTGLWWCQAQGARLPAPPYKRGTPQNKSGAGRPFCASSSEANQPSPNIAEWSEAVRLSGPGPWKPVLRYGEIDSQKMFVFYDGVYPNTAGGPIPFNFTLNCLEIDRPS